MKFANWLFALGLALSVNANAADTELKPGQSVVVCASDRSGGSYGSTSGLGSLNEMLLSNEVRTKGSGFTELSVVIRSPFAVSAPSVSIKDNGNDKYNGSDYKTYCVTVTKQ